MHPARRDGMNRVGVGEREDRIGCTAAWWVPAMELGAAPK